MSTASRTEPFQIGKQAHTIYSFAEAFETAAREQHGTYPIPSRLPTEKEVAAMLENVSTIKKQLEDVRNMVQQSRLNHERARESGVRKGFEDEDAGIYADGLKPTYGITEVKKRRGVSSFVSPVPIPIFSYNVSARGSTRQMSQLQQNRYSRVAARTRWCENSLQRLWSSLRQVGKETAARTEVDTTQTFG
jgi:hypothetical protein